MSTATPLTQRRVEASGTMSEPRQPLDMVRATVRRGSRNESEHSADHPIKAG